MSKNQKVTETNNGLQNTTHKTTDCSTQNPLEQSSNICQNQIYLFNIII
jgi:hypothetical protein